MIRADSFTGGRFLRFGKRVSFALLKVLFVEVLNGMEAVAGHAGGE